MKSLGNRGGQPVVAARRGDQVVEAVDTDRRQLVDDGRVFELFLHNT